MAVGASRGPATLAFLLGTVGATLFLLADPRRRFMTVAPPRLDLAWWKRALKATMPSTVTLAVLCGISLAFSPTLAAALAGMNAGLGIGGVVATYAWRVG